jgi:hypothetical protein
VRLLEPTERLIAKHQRRWANQCEAIALVKPEAAGILAALDRPDFAPALICQLGDYCRQVVRVTAYSPQLSVFSERDSGLMVLCNLIAASRPDAPLSAPVPISISDLARRFGAARSHIRKLLQEVARESFVERAPREDPVVMLPRLIDAAENFFAMTFLHLNHCGRLALDEIRQGPATG